MLQSFNILKNQPTLQFVQSVHIPCSKAVTERRGESHVPTRAVHTNRDRFAKRWHLIDRTVAVTYDCFKMREPDDTTDPVLASALRLRNAQAAFEEAREALLYAKVDNAIDVAIRRFGSQRAMDIASVRSLRDLRNDFEVVALLKRLNREAGFE